MEIVVLGSGSSGNATIVRSGAISILLEAGLSAKQIAERARARGCDPDRVSAIFVSHAHADHVQGASVFSRRHRVPVHMTDAAYEVWLRFGGGSGRTFGGRRSVSWTPKRQAMDQRAEAWLFSGLEGAGAPMPDAEADGPLPGPDAEAVGTLPGPDEDGPPLPGEEDAEPFYARHTLDDGGIVDLGCIRVRTFPVPHDCAGTVGYVVEAEGMRFGYVTDLGHVTALVIERLRGCDALLIEMNHDLDLLREGPYPWDVKQRIASRHGHLSNEQGASLLEHALGADTRFVMLGHLSETNNEPGLAL